MFPAALYDKRDVPPVPNISNELPLPRNSTLLPPGAPTVIVCVDIVPVLILSAVISTMSPLPTCPILTGLPLAKTAAES